LKFLLISPFTLTFKNSVLSAIFKFAAGLNDVSSNVLIKFSFQSSRISCQIPRTIVRVIQNKEKTKNL